MNAYGANTFAANAFTSNAFHGPTTSSSTRRNQGGRARIQATITRTQSGVARIQTRALKDQPGVARIQARTTRDQLAVANIRNTTTRTQVGTARLQITTIRNQTGLARIVFNITTTRPQLGLSRVQARQTRNQSGVARIIVTSGGTRNAPQQFNEEFSVGVYFGFGLAALQRPPRPSRRLYPIDARIIVLSDKTRHLRYQLPVLPVDDILVLISGNLAADPRNRTIVDEHGTNVGVFDPTTGLIDIDVDKAPGPVTRFVSYYSRGLLIDGP